MWTGSAFSSSCDSNEIILLHNRFPKGTTGVCNNGAIVARSIGVGDNRYTSQLTVNVTSELNNKTAICLVNSDVGMATIGEAVIRHVVVSGKLLFSCVIYLEHCCYSYTSVIMVN